MMEEKINSYQFLVLVIFFTIGTSVLIVPSDLAEQAKQDAWLGAVVGTALGLLVIWLYCKIAQWLPHLSFVQINEKILGKWIGKTVSVSFVFMAFLYAAALLFHSGSFLKTHAMPNTPMAALNILMAFIIVMGVRLGLETIARAAEILILAFFFLFIFLVAFVSPEIKIENIQPVYEAGTKTIMKSSLFFIAVSSLNSVILLMIFPATINKSKQGKTSFMMGNLIGGIVIIILTFLCITVIGADNTSRQLYPGFELVKRINIGDFIQRIEGVMAALWVITLYFKATLYFYASVSGLAQILNMKDYRPLTLPLGMIAVVLSLIVYPNIVYQQEWDATTGFTYTVIIGLFLPILLVVVYAFRKKIRKKED